MGIKYNISCSNDNLKRQSHYFFNYRHSVNIFIYQNLTYPRFLFNSSPPLFLPLRSYTIDQLTEVRLWQDCIYTLTASTVFSIYVLEERQNWDLTRCIAIMNLFLLSHEWIMRHVINTDGKTEIGKIKYDWILYINAVYISATISLLQTYFIKRYF